MYVCRVGTGICRGRQRVLGPLELVMTAWSYLTRGLGATWGPLITAELPPARHDFTLRYDSEMG